MRSRARRIAGASLLLLLLAGCTPEGGAERSRPAFDVQGHRGARGLAPENTLPSFEHALDLQVDTLELDLHFSADDALVVWHDPVLTAEKCRMGPSEQPARVRALTLAQLAGYRCDRNPDPERFPLQSNDPTPLAGDDYRIVEVTSVFDFVQRYGQDASKTAAQREASRRVRFNIETKREAKQPQNIGDGFDGEIAGPFERELDRWIREHELEHRVTVQSFDHRSLWAMRALNPRIELAALTESDAKPEELAERGADIWSPWHKELDAEKIERAHALGLRVVPWTVNDVERMRALRGLGVDGVITDRPDLAVGLRVVFQRMDLPAK